jgi:hypothetical protein
MYRFFLLLLFLSLTTGLAAQTITVSEEIPLRSDTRYDLIGRMGNHTLLFQDRNPKFLVQAFDARMRSSWEKEIELDKRNAKLLALVPGYADFTLLYTFRDRSHTLLKLHRYDPAANLRDSTLLHDFGFLFYTPDFNWVRSEDRTKLVVYYHENQQMLQAICIDLRSAEVLWLQAVQPEDFYYNENFLQAVVTNDGDLYYILERDNFRSRRKEHHYEVLQLTEDAPPRTTEVILGDQLTYDVFFRYDNANDHLVGGGLYSEKDITRAAGYFYLNIPSDDIGNFDLQFSAFADELVESIRGKEIKENKGIEELSVREIVLRRDGGALLVMERNRQFERRSGVANRTFYDNSARLMVDYYYDELIVCAVHPNGQPHWANILYKKQYSQDDQGVYSSYFLLRGENKLRFLFNDEIRYENTISEYTVLSSGEFDRNSLLSTANLELRLRFRDAMQVGYNQIIVPSERKNRLRLVHMVYE